MMLYHSTIMRCLLFNNKTTNFDLSTISCYHIILFVFKLHTGTSVFVSWQSKHVRSRTNTEHRGLHLKCLKKWTLTSAVHCISWRGIAWIPKMFYMFCIMYIQLFSVITFHHTWSKYLFSCFIVYLHQGQQSLWKAWLSSFPYMQSNMELAIL
jgi:hypothetical protein